MILKQIRLLNFKSYKEKVLDLASPIVLFYGANGSGKTNLLDAIYFLSLSKSYFNLADKYLVNHGEGFFRMDATFESDQDEQKGIVYKYKHGQRKEIEINGQKLMSPIELMGRFPVVFVAPDDIKIIREGSRERRDFVNRILCQTDTEYIRCLMNYRALLRQKDALLKGYKRADPLVIDAFNERLLPLGNLIFQKRKTFCDTFSLDAQAIYGSLSNHRESIKIVYESQLLKRPFDSLLKESQHEEILNRRTLVGTHKDDFILLINGKSIKKFGSQGQMKSLLYALRLSEYNYLKASTGVKAILMLDDYFEKLDNHRLDHLLQLITADEFGQIFLTDTELERSARIFGGLGVDFTPIEIK